MGEMARATVRDPFDQRLEFDQEIRLVLAKIGLSS